jgi:quinol-cytochrome oxidoreductase complex cytochrome b subunit
MYAGWMTIVGAVFASGLWLAWEGYQHDAQAPGRLRERAMLLIAIVLAAAAIGLGVIGFATLIDPASATMLVSILALVAAIALGAGAIALFQAVRHVRHARGSRR